MAKMEQLRDRLSGPLTLDYVQRMLRDGWQPVAVEWVRELAGEPGEELPPTREEVPFGLRVADDCKRLEEDPAEVEVLMAIMEGIVQDRRLSQIAEDLNAREFRTRYGSKWGPAAVFNLLPRLIEAGPRIFSKEEWAARRQHLGTAG